MPVQTKYRGIVRNGILAATAAGPLGAFPGAFDAGAVGGIWTTMFVSIANRAGHQIDGAFVSKFITIVGTGALTYVVGCKAATWLFHLIPGAGTLTAMGVSSLLNAIFTYKFGATVSHLIDKPDFDFDDAATAAASVLALMRQFPKLEEVRDLLDINNSVA